MAEFKIIRDSEQQHYLQSRNQIQVFGGGFGNGKTGTTCVKILEIAISYPGSRGVFARSTKPKLEDTVKPEFFKWCPVDWIAKMPTEKHNDVILKNGSSVHFRHVRQEGKGRGENASNLLSATYDYAAVDQIDDPAFTHKDFQDLGSRLRGTTKYVGDDPTMPKIGPQWLMVTCNPTRNWVFKKIVNPIHIYRRNGIVTSELIYDRDNKKCLVDLYEASTYTNMHNTGERYVSLLKAMYKGSMAERFLEGKWGAYEGLVYPEFDNAIHVLEQHQLREYIKSVIDGGEFGIVEGYDHGIVVPSCYMLGIVDKYNNTYIIDGIYDVGIKIPDFADRIRAIRESWNVIPSDPIDADPAIFRVGTHKELVGESVSQMYSDEGITMRRGNNNIVAGVAKIASHLTMQKFHFNPVTREYGSPHLFFSSELEWLANEMGDYYWNRNIAGDNVDKPRDTNDHAMDTLKYMYTTRPRIGRPRIVDRRLPPLLSQWSEDTRPKNRVSIRHMH